jgi:NagD protein
MLPVSSSAALAQLAAPAEPLSALDLHSETTAMVDRMDTDIVSGLEGGPEAILVVTGVTTRAEADRHPYPTSRIVDSIADLIDDIG